MTRRATLGDRAFPVVAARAWNALRIMLHQRLPPHHSVLKIRSAYRHICRLWFVNVSPEIIIILFVLFFAVQLKKLILYAVILQQVQPYICKNKNVGQLENFARRITELQYIFKIFWSSKGSSLNDIALRVHTSELRDVSCHNGITQCYLPPDTSERVLTNPSQKGWYLILPTPEGWKAELTYLHGWLHTEMVYLQYYGRHPASQLEEV